MLRAVLAILAVALLTSCGKTEQPRADHPQLSIKVAMRDQVFRSAALNREMRYRVLLPASIAPGQILPVVYLLHGAGGDFRDWSNYSDVAQYAESGLILVMPQGDDSYYVNAAESAGDRYEDYIVHDLLSDVGANFPAARNRANRAIGGISMGGYGAIKLALSHPDLFIFAGALSPAIDVPRRSFSLRRIRQSQNFYSLFGSSGGEARRRNDPFLLVPKVDSSKAAYFFLTCGEGESLLPPNREFAGLLKQQGISSEFHVMPGGHEWEQWNRQLPRVFASLRQHVGREPK